MGPPLPPSENLRPLGPGEANYNSPSDFVSCPPHHLLWPVSPPQGLGTCHPSPTALFLQVAAEPLTHPIPAHASSSQ